MLERYFTIAGEECGIFEWNARANEAVAEQVDAERLAALREEAAERLAELQDAIANINEQLRLAAGDHFTLPRIEVPMAEVDERASTLALVNFGDAWFSATRPLILRKAYEGGHA